MSIEKIQPIEPIKIVYSEINQSNKKVNCKTNSFSIEMNMDLENALMTSPYHARWQFYLLGFYDARNGVKRDIIPLLKTINAKYLKLKEEDEQYGVIQIHYQNGKHKFLEEQQLYELGIIKENPEYQPIQFFYSQPGLYEEIKQVIEEYPDFEYEMNLVNQNKNRG